MNFTSLANLLMKKGNEFGHYQAIVRNKIEPAAIEHFRETIFSKDGNQPPTQLELRVDVNRIAYGGRGVDLSICLYDKKTGKKFTTYAVPLLQDGDSVTVAQLNNLFKFTYSY